MRRAEISVWVQSQEKVDVPAEGNEAGVPSYSRESEPFCSSQVLQ